MSEQENPDAGVGHSAAIDTNCLTIHELQSNSGAEVSLVNGRGLGMEWPPPARSPDVIVVTESDPMSGLAGRVQWFEPFEIRRAKSVLEIWVRMVQGMIALCFSLGALAVTARWAQLALGGQQVFRPDQSFGYMLMYQGAISFLAVLMVFVTARRFLYWKVDMTGIHQHWFGFRNWSVAWNEIVSRRLGPVATPAWLFLFIVPIAGGYYQPIVLEDRRGRKRKVNRLGTNGGRLDAMLRQYLNSPGEAQQAQLYSNGIQKAQAIYSRRDPARIPLYLSSRHSPVVRMTFHEPKLLPVCCNCLGPAAVRVPISTSPGLLGWFNDNFLRLLIPLCSECQARMRRSVYAQFGRLAIALAFFSLAGIAFALAFDQTMLPRVFFTILGLCFSVPLVAMLWNETKRPSAAKLVKVVRASCAGNWMEVRFGNPDYARLVAN